MGIYLGNRKGVAVEEILAFKESLSLILITTLFILLAARLDLAQIETLGWVAVQIFVVIQFVARPLKVLFATWGSSLTWRERALLGWIAPRGIVAAAVTALFALKLEKSGFAQAELLVPLTFVVIIGTVVLQSLTARPLAKLLKVAEPHSDGFLILGANPLARAVAEALVKQKLPVLLTDTSWDNVSRARMAGLPTYYGNPLSEHAEVYLNMTGLGRLLALSTDTHLNELACTRFDEDFGAKELFALRVGATGQARSSALKAGRAAFGENANFVDLSRRLHRGAEIRKTNLSETFTIERFWATHGERAVPLFAISPKGYLETFTADSTPSVGPGWSLLALIDPAPTAAPEIAPGGEPVTEAVAELG
jgi:CPA1 family monovalent cation:H+ antiporter